MCDQSSFIAQKIPESYFLDGELIVDHDGFGSQQVWMTGDGMDYFGDSCATHALEEVEKWNSTNGESGPCVMDLQFCPTEGQQFLANTHMSLDFEAESPFGDRRVSSSSTDSNESDIWPAVVGPGPPSVRGGCKSRWLCAQCNQTFSTSQELERHARYIQHKAYVCKECKKGFSRRDTFGRHVVTHRVSAGLHQCEICKASNVEAAFKRKDHLEQHKRNRHPNLSRPIIRSTLGAIDYFARFN